MKYSIKLLIKKTIIVFLALPILIVPAQSQTINSAQKNIIGQELIHYDDVMGIALESDIVVDVMVKKIIKLPPSQAIGVRSDRKRILIIANVQSLIRAQSGLNGEIKFLFDAPIDSRGKIPKLKKQRFIAFGGHVPNRSDFIKLSRTASIIPYGPNIASLTRSIVTETIAANAPRRIIGVNSAFHSPGTIIGEGETQIFMETELDQPMVISINSRSGENKRWSLSTSEVIDINALEPKRLSLAGYRLACDLPPSIVPNIIESLTPANQRKVVSDYNFIRNAIGPCKRSLKWD